MSFYANAFNIAKSLLTKYGQVVTLSGSSSGGGFDPATGEPISETVETVSGVGALFGYKTNEIDGTVILAGDSKLTISTTGTPKVGMTTTLNGSVWRVMAVDEIAPAGSVVYYNVQLRK